MHLHLLLILLSVFIQSYSYGVNADTLRPSGNSYLAEISTRYVYDSNIFRTKENAVSDSIMEFSPNIEINMVPRGNWVSASYSGQYGRYVLHQVEDYFHHNFGAKYFSSKDSAFILGSAVNYSRSQDVRGSTGNYLLPNETPNFWSKKLVNANFSYRKTDSRTTLVGHVQRKNINYDKNSEKVNDLESTEFLIKNRYRMTGKTDVYAYISWAEILSPYMNDPLQKDNSETHYVVGVEWYTSGKVTSYAEIGWVNKSYKKRNNQDLSTLTSNIKFRWKRKSYSEFEVNLVRNTQDHVEGDSLSYVRNDLNIMWLHKFTHQWHASFNVNTVINRAKSDYVDYFLTISPKISFNFTRWLVADTLLSWENKKSSSNVGEYNVFKVSSTVTAIFR